MYSMYMRYVVPENVEKKFNQEYAMKQSDIMTAYRLWNMIHNELGAAVTKISLYAENNYELLGAIAAINAASETVDKAMRLIPDPLDHDTHPIGKPSS